MTKEILPTLEEIQEIITVEYQDLENEIKRAKRKEIEEVDRKKIQSLQQQFS